MVNVRLERLDCSPVQRTALLFQNARVKIRTAQHRKTDTALKIFISHKMPTNSEAQRRSATLSLPQAGQE
jgi:hypothetical protein